MRTWIAGRRIATATAVAALAVGLTGAPVQAAPPTVAGEYGTISATVKQPIRSELCIEAVTVAHTVDLAAIGDTLQAQGWYESGSSPRPVRTTLKWESTTSITGPDNFYDQDTDFGYYPSNVSTRNVEVCPSDFGAGVVSPGTYQVTTTVAVENYPYDICHATEPCDTFEGIWTKTLTTSFTLGFSQPCLDARSALASLKAQLLKAKKTLKRAKASHDRLRVRKAKKAVTRVKGKVSRAAEVVDGSC